MVDSGSHVTLISNEGAAKRNLTVIPNPKQYLPPGGGNTLLSPGYVKVSRLNVGRTTLKDLHIRVADVHDVCAPADGIPRSSAPSGGSTGKGGTVGAVIGGLVVAAMAGWLFVRRRQQHRTAASAAARVHTVPTGPQAEFAALVK